MLNVLKLLPRDVFEVWQWETRRLERMGLRLKTCVKSSFIHFFFNLMYYSVDLQSCSPSSTSYHIIQYAANFRRLNIKLCHLHFTLYLHD